MLPSVATKDTLNRSPALVLAVAAASLLGVALFAQTVLETSDLSQAFVSDGSRQAILKAVGGKLTATNDGLMAVAPLLPLAGIVAVLGVLFSVGIAAIRRGTGSLTDHLFSAVWSVSLVWLPVGLWWLLWMVALLSGWLDGQSSFKNIPALLLATVDLTVATSLALTALAACKKPSTPAALSSRGATSATPNRPARLTLIAGIAAYTLVFTALNWGLWFNLRLPHGDSAMYEEHLWNLEHGKGFRSYLDQGLFLGEHLQVVHVLLVPLHLIFPSHLTLEFAQSLILALGAWPVFNIARRHSGSEWAAALLGLAYLAYVPLQYLDISIDLKTFRPNSFGIPTLLAAIDLLERRRYGWASFWLAITLSAQEDWAIPLALLGAYFALESVLTKRVAGAGPTAGREAPGSPRRTASTSRPQLLYGLALFLFSITYLWLALNVLIPWFRGGATVHTASYFSRFGNSPREIIVTLLTDWPLVWNTIVTPAAFVYALRLLLPIGFLPLLSPGRLLVAAPLFLLLLMNDLAMQTPAPIHHFHAPLIPLLFWAAAAGLSPKSDSTHAAG